MTIYIQIQEDPRFSGERDFYWRSGEIIIILTFIIHMSFYSLIILYNHLISNLWLFYIIRFISDLDVSLFHEKFGSKRKIINKINQSLIAKNRHFLFQLNNIKFIINFRSNIFIFSYLINFFFRVYRSFSLQISWSTGVSSKVRVIASFRRGYILQRRQ